MTLKNYRKVALPKKVLIGSGGGLGVFKNGFQEITEQYICRYNVIIHYTAERRDVLENTPPRIERFAEAGILHPEAREIARGQISRSEEGVFSNSSQLEAVY